MYGSLFTSLFRPSFLNLINGINISISLQQDINENYMVPSVLIIHSYVGLLSVPDQLTT